MVILGDTRDSTLLSEVAQNADVVVHEATLEDALRDQAVAHGHSTPSMAAAFAASLNCKKLILTHFSQRYKERESCADEEEVAQCCVEKLMAEAKQALGDSVSMEIDLAKDLKVFDIPANS